MSENVSEDQGDVPAPARLAGRLIPILGLILFLAAVFYLHHELGRYRYHDIVRSLKSIPAGRLWLSFLLTASSYALQVGYDLLALRQIGKRLPVRRVGFASFIANALSNTLAHPLLTGAPARYRYYTAWGLSGGDVARTFTIVHLTFGLGFLALAGAVLPTAAAVLSKALAVSPATPALVGFACVALLLAAFAVSLARGRFRVPKLEAVIPNPGMMLAQTGLAAADLLFSAGALLVLLPSGGAAPAVLFAAYLIALVPGLVTQIPGGIGVFEATVVLLLAPAFGVDGLSGPLLAYRFLYYVVPLGLAAALIAGYEITRKKDDVQRVSRFFTDRILPGFAPQIFAFATFISGAILLLSGATPSESDRLAWIRDVMPLPVLEVSHFVGSLIGAALLVLARGLQRRLDGAWALTVAMLAGGIVMSLAKGFDYEEAIILLVMLVALLPCHRYFYRKASLINQSFTPGWMLAIALIVGGSIWAGLFSYRHVEYSDTLWWRFAVNGEASRFMRASVGAVAVVVIVSVIRLLRAAPPLPEPPTAEDKEIIRGIVDRSPDSSAWLALLGDKRFLFNEARTAFIMYGVSGRSWLAMGDPVGPEEEWPELIWRFRDLCDRHEGYCAFVQVGPDSLPYYLDLGLTLLKLGEDARVRVSDFSLDGSRRSGLRYTRKKCARLNCAFEVIPPGEVAPRLPELKAISDSWLAEKSTAEKGFTLGAFQEDYLRQCPIGLVTVDGRVVAFANLWAGSNRREASIDLMRHARDAPADVMEYLFIELLLWSREQGYEWFSLGLVPMSGIADRRNAPMWNRIASLTFRHGEAFYNFQGLRKFKNKFDPEWVPRYLAVPGGLAVPRVLADLATVTSGDLRGLIGR